MFFTAGLLRYVILKFDQLNLASWLGKVMTFVDNVEIIFTDVDRTSFQSCFDNDSSKK